MYDPLETDISREQLVLISKECKKRDIPTCIIGGWAAYFYVNQEYRRAFGKDYMGSRDIDIFFDPKKQKEFSDVVTKLGFEKSGLYFRYVKFYNRVTKKFITEKETKTEEPFNLIHIFLDLFSNKRTTTINSWSDLKPLEKISQVLIDGFSVADIKTLVDLKCIALFDREKADKENKDACDLYALLEYSKKSIASTELLIKAIEKILGRSDLLYIIAQHVLLDPGKQNIVEVSLKSKLKDLGKDIPYGTEEKTISKKELESVKKVESPNGKK